MSNRAQVVASVSLVELAGRRHDTAPQGLSPVPPAAPALTPAVSADTPTEPAIAPPIESAPLGSEVSGWVEDTRVAANTDTHTGLDVDVDGVDADRDDADHADGDDADHGERELDEAAELAADLVSLLPAARAARDELVDEGHTVSRDALARRLRRNGHSIRNNRVSELLAALRQETPSVNGSRPTASV